MYENGSPRDHSPKIIAVDLDKTLVIPAKNYYKKKPQYIVGRPVEGKPNKRLINVLNKLCEEYDTKIIIYTARHWGDYGEIKKWLWEHTVCFSEIICNKLDFDILIDDKAALPSVSAREILKRTKPCELEMW